MGGHICTQTPFAQTVVNVFAKLTYATFLKFPNPLVWLHPLLLAQPHRIPQEIIFLTELTIKILTLQTIFFIHLSKQPQYISPSNII